MAAIGLLELELSIPQSTSLKDKRKVIRSIKDRVHNQVNVSIAEVGHWDVWNRSHLAVVTVAVDRKTVERRFHMVSQMADQLPGTEVLERMIQWL